MIDRALRNLSTVKFPDLHHLLLSLYEVLKAVKDVSPQKKAFYRSTFAAKMWNSCVIIETVVLSFSISV